MLLQQGLGYNVKKARGPAFDFGHTRAFDHTGEGAMRSRESSG
jgi:hypothetical protein